MVLQKRPCFCSPAARPDICPDLGGVGSDLARQEVEARFIHENQGAALAAGLVLEPRPDRDAPLLDLLLVALDGPRNRQLGRPAQFLQKPGDVTLVVGDAELLFDDFGDAGTGPDLAAKAVGFRPVRKKVGDETQLIRFELGGRAEVGSREQRSRTFTARRRNPPAYRPLGDTEGDGDLPLLPTELLEAPGLHSPPLSPVLRIGALGVHALLYGPKNFTFLRNAQLDFCPFCTHSHQPIRLPRWYNGGVFEVPSRPGEEAIMFALPKAALPLFRSVAGACVLPTAKRLLTLMVGAILATGRRTITNLLRAVGGLAPGHPSSYHRVFSRRRWSLWPLAHGLADLILRHWVPEGSVALAGDDTVDEHRGAHVYGKGRHRDPVRSTHSYTAYRWGHKWVVLAILVRFPFANRPWALPVLVALYRSREWNQQHRRRHRTPAQLLRRLVAVLLHWFPHRHFTLTGDGGYGSHEMARFAHRHRRRLTLVSRFVPDAQLYAPRR